MEKQYKLHNKIISELMDDTVVDYWGTAQVQVPFMKPRHVTLFSDTFYITCNMKYDFHNYLKVYGFTNNEEKSLLTRYARLVRKEIERQRNFITE
jgi:hypothetical protein